MLGPMSEALGLEVSPERKAFLMQVIKEEGKEEQGVGGEGLSEGRPRATRMGMLNNGRFGEYGSWVGRMKY